MGDAKGCSSLSTRIYNPPVTQLPQLASLCLTGHPPCQAISGSLVSFSKVQLGSYHFLAHGGGGGGAGGNGGIE